jgi:hypothetical protein
LGFEYQATPVQAFSLGFGIHSKVETLATYNAIVESNEGDFYMPNKNLDLAKALHIVAGYKYMFSQNLHLKTELYYQYLYDVAVENDPSSPVVLNNIMSGYENIDLVNEGAGI